MKCVELLVIALGGWRSSKDSTPPTKPVANATVDLDICVLRTVVLLKKVNNKQSSASTAKAD
jgi:hypothetical protein